MKLSPADLPNRTRSLGSDKARGPHRSLCDKLDACASGFAALLCGKPMAFRQVAKAFIFNFPLLAAGRKGTAFPHSGRQSRASASCHTNSHWGGRLAKLGIATTAAFLTILLFAYNPEQDQVNSQAAPTKWNNNSVIWNLNPTTGTNVQAGSNVQGALTSAFNTWQTASMTLGGQQQTVVSLNITLGQVSSTLPTQPNSGDCLNVVSFADMTKSDFPMGTIAITFISTVTANPGQSPPFQFSCTGAANQTCNLLSCLADADIMFNPSETFTTLTPTPANAFDIQTIATHEIGHLLGLDHSGLGNAVMYPFGDAGLSGSRVLSVDDEAGIAFLYPASNFGQLTGTLSGTVTSSGSGIFGAHVVAIDANTGNAIIDGLTAPDGTYNLVGVPPGSYNVLALPLAGFYTLSDFSGWSCGYDEAANAPPCCDPSMPSCNGKPVANPTNYTGKFF